MTFWLSTLSKMSFKEGAEKYFCRMSCGSGQSRSICFTVNTASQDVHIANAPLKMCTKCKGILLLSWKNLSCHQLGHTTVLVTYNCDFNKTVLLNFHGEITQLTDDPLETVLLGKYLLAYLRGKRSCKMVPVIIPVDTADAMKLLPTTKSADSHVNGWHSVYDWHSVYGCQWLSQRSTWQRRWGTEHPHSVGFTREWRQYVLQPHGTQLSYNL